jgi:nucleoside-diphosphate-sugar epimerase
VPEVAREDAFDEVIKTPGIEVVMHTASPCTMKFTDPQKELVDPAVLGTTNILRAAQRHAPQIRRVIITSSIAAIHNVWDPSCVLTEASWNPNDLKNIHDSAGMAYCVAKTLAERAAWDFIAKENPNFDLTTINPPWVFGPVMPHLASLDTINTSNQQFVNLVRGKWKDAMPATGPVNVWVDVRDVARAHMIAMERSAAGGKRLFTIAGRFSYAEIADVVRGNAPDYKDVLPSADAGERNPGTVIQYNNDLTNSVLDIQWRSLNDCVRDFLDSIKDFAI